MSQFIDITVPEGEQESATSTLAVWLNAVGDTITIHDPIAEIETDKVTVEVTAPTGGILREVLVEEGDEVSSGTVIGRIQTTDGAPAPTQDLAASQPDEAYQDQKLEIAKRQIRRKSHSDALRLSPAVKALLAESDLKPQDIAATGGGGRITRQDVLDHIETQPSPPALSSSSIPSRMVSHHPMRRRIANHMVASLLKTAPHVTAIFEMDFSAIIAHRLSHKADFEQRGAKLTYTAYFIAASVQAIGAVPEVNSRFHPDALEIFDDVNIGVGTALGEKGLIVPVIQKAQNLDLFTIAKNLTSLINKARNGQLLASDVQKGTFTISNHGVSGSLIATPIIINQPQSAILGIGKLQKRMMVIEENGEDVARIKPMAYVTLSIDHRGLDAFQTNAFLSRFVEVIEGWT